jgi:hypothetical protein
MLTLQARVTLIAYVILMVAFFIPLKGDMDLLNKFGTSLIMLLPVSLSVYIINCMVTGSKAKLGLGCNAIAWIESLYILIIAVIVLLYNLMNSKKDTIENFYNTGSCGSNAVYGSKSYGSCIVTGSSCGSGLITYTQTASGCPDITGSEACNIECDDSSDDNTGSCGSDAYGSKSYGSCIVTGSSCGSGLITYTQSASGCPDITGSEACNIECDDSSDDNTGSCGSDAVYGSAESYGSCTQIGSDCGSTAGSQAYIQTASGCSDRITYQPCNIDCLPNCQYSMAEFGSGCIINNNRCEKLVTMEANNGSNCIGSQSYTEYIGCFGSDSDVCDFGSDDVSEDYQTRRNLYDSLISYSTQYSGVNPQLIESIISRMTSEQINNLNSQSAKQSFLQSVNDSIDSGNGNTYDTSKISDIEQIINTAISSVSSLTSSDGDASQSGSENNILHNFITAIQDYGPSNDSFTYSAEPVGSDSDRYKYCINNVDFGNPDCIIVGPGIIQQHTD